MKPADYRRYMEELRPVVVQVSGGEPLMRDDLSDVIRAIRRPNGLPFLILVSNWSQMTLERYVDLCKAGVDQFSVSLDFPDERHDDFRGHAGLYEHLRQIVPAAAKLGYDNICLNNCITSENVEYINAAADKAKEWGVNINYSAYSPRRTGCRDYFLTTHAQLETLRGELARLKTRIDSRWVTNSVTTIDATAALLRDRRRARLQGRAALAGGDVRRQAAAVLDAVQAVRPERPGQNGERVHARTTRATSATSRFVRASTSRSPQLLGENLSGFFSFSNSAPGK